CQLGQNQRDGGAVAAASRLPPPGHSGLSPVNLTTLPHFSVSSTMSRPNSEGEPASGSPPISANFALIAGSARAAVILRFDLSTTSTGVFFGAAMPYHWLAS